MWHRGTRFKTPLVETTGTGWFDREGVERKPNVTDKGSHFFTCSKSCTRCGGEGGAIKWEPTGYTCYRCGGNGIDPRPLRMRLYTAEILAKLNTRRDAQRAKKAAKAEAARVEKEAAEEAARAARAEALAADPLFITLTKYAPRNEFLSELLGKLRVRDLSEKQIAAADAAVARLAKADALVESSQFLGAEGDRIKLDATVTFTRCIHQAEPGEWVGGRPDVSRWLIKMETADGSVAVWFTSHAFKEGAHIVGTATVKSLDTYNGIKQTVLKNVRRKKETAE